MLNREEISWLKKSANELNNLLQEISASAYRIENLCSSLPEVRQYLAITVQSVERASKVTGSILQRVRASETVIEKIAVGGSPQSDYGKFHVVLEAAPAGSSASAEDQPPLPPPVTGVEDPVETAKEFGLTVANPNGPKELIMMVDDENAVLMLAKMMLTDAGYRVVAVAEPVKALELFKRIHSHVGLVILDFAMPVMDGGELYDSMRLVSPKVSAVLSSGFADQNKLSQMLAKGLKGFIPKPYTPDKLLMQIRSVLDIARRRQAGQ